MARYGCLALAVIVALALLFFIVFLWSGWLNRPVGHNPAVTETGVVSELRINSPVDKIASRTGVV
jgi:hypothetical protein